MQFSYDTPFYGFCCPKALRRAAALAVFSSLVFGASSTAHAQLIASDSWLTNNAEADQYNTGNLNNQGATDGVVGFSGNWGAALGTGSTQNWQAESGGLSHSLVVNPQNGSNGNVFAQGGGGTRTNQRQLAAYDTTLDEYWMSGLVNVRETTGGNIRMGLTSGMAFDDNPAAGILFGTQNSNFFLYYTNTSGAREQAAALLGDGVTPFAFSLDTTYMATIQMEVFSGEDDLFTMSIYESGNLNPVASVQVEGLLTPSTDLQYLTFNHSSNPPGSPNQHRFDEFRFGSSMDAVMIPEPRTYALFAGGLGLAMVLLRRRKSVPAQ